MANMIELWIHVWAWDSTQLICCFLNGWNVSMVVSKHYDVIFLHLTKRKSYIELKKDWDFASSTKHLSYIHNLQQVTRDCFLCIVDMLVEIWWHWALQSLMENPKAAVNGGCTSPPFRHHLPQVANLTRNSKIAQSKAGAKVEAIKDEASLVVEDAGKVVKMNADLNLELSVESTPGIFIIHCGFVYLWKIHQVMSSFIVGLCINEKGIIYFLLLSYTQN